MSAPRSGISVVVPSVGRQLALTRCLLALQEQDLLPGEVLVAYRDDDHDTAGLVRAWNTGTFPVEGVAVGTANASEARNQCIARARGEIIAFLDDDAVARPGWIAAIQAAFDADSRLGGVGGPDWVDGVELPLSDRPAETGVVQWWGRRVGNHHRGAPAVRAVEWLKGANMSFRRAALAGIRFGEGLRGVAAQFAEDVGVSLQVRRAGWSLQYDPAVAVDHFPGQLTLGCDHRRLRDRQSLADAAFNDTVVMLRYLPPVRRAVFLLWGWAVGTRMLPGVIASIALWPTERAGVLARWRVVARGRWQGWRAPAGAVRGVVEDAPRASGAARPLTVCLITHVVHPGDGQGRVNYELARWLANQGHAVTLVASDVDAALQRLPGIRWIRVAVPRRAPEPLRWLIFAWRVRRILGPAPDRTYDVVHVNGAIAPVRASVNTSHFVHTAWAPVLAALEDQGSRNWYQRLVTGACGWLERRAYRSAANVVAVSESVGQSLRSAVGMSAAQVAVIHTGVDSVEFRPPLADEVPALRGAHGIPVDGFVVLFIGDACSPRKNLDLALRAVAASDQRVHLAVVGNSSQGPYPAAAQQLGIATRVHFLGPRANVAAIYRDADVVFCAAHYEPASLVLLEAMASGTPVITAPHVGNAVFVVDGENGFLLRSSADVEEAVRVIRLLADDAGRRRAIGTAARATAAALTWERMAIRYESLYRAVA